jgi:glycosyltransferase involved in cell wall biosynthesis
MNLSVGLVTLNEEKDLARTLNAVKDIADEIIIVDSGSTDKTVEIARSFNASVFIEEWKGIGRQKNSVIDKCKGKWILLIDADEEITPELRERIRNIIKSQTPEYKVYKIPFRTVCFGKEIKYGGWSGFYRMRLFLNGAGRCNDKQVHENFITSAPAKIIKEYIKHHTYNDWEDFFEKFNDYTSQLATRYLEKGRNKSMASVYISAKFSFLRSYIFRLGFLDGFEGYVLAKAGSMYVLTKYAKLHHLKKMQQR